MCSILHNLYKFEIFHLLRIWKEIINPVLSRYHANFWEKQAKSDSAVALSLSMIRTTVMVSRRVSRHFSFGPELLRYRHDNVAGAEASARPRPGQAKRQDAEKATGPPRSAAPRLPSKRGSIIIEFVLDVKMFCPLLLGESSLASWNHYRHGSRDTLIPTPALDRVAASPRGKIFRIFWMIIVNVNSHWLIIFSILSLL